MEIKKIKVPFTIKKPVLALGAQTKNTLCFAKGNYAYLSRVHQDLNNPKDLFNFEKDAAYFLKKHPKVIAYDLHPEYQSSKYALHLSAKSYELSAIQHHHAHIASCMAERGLKNQKVIGVAFDGTGLGNDNTLWGGEFLLCDYKDFQRRAHLSQAPLLGGEMAISEPWRLTAFWLYTAYKDRFLNLGIGFTKGIRKKQWQALKKIYLSGYDFPLSSSMGRLFDAVASLVLEKYRVNFEAQLAIELEKTATPVSGGNKSYAFKITKKNSAYIIDPIPMFKQIVSDLQDSVPKTTIAHAFHFTVAVMIKKTCLILRKEHKANKIVLSGGVFQNNLLLRLSRDLLYKEGFQVFVPRDLFCNDAGLSLGQALIAGGVS